MPFGAHETMEVHEILNEKVNVIRHFSLYAGQCANGELRSMIERHLQSAIASYDQLVAYTHDYNAAQMRPQRMPDMMNASPQDITYGLRQPSPVHPQMQGSLDDQAIVMAVLSCHKNSAKNHLAKCLECADPNLREMLLHGAITCAEQAYEVFLYMNRQGQYQVPTLHDHTAKTFLHTFQPAGQPMGGTGMMQQIPSSAGQTGAAAGSMPSGMGTPMSSSTARHGQTSMPVHSAGDPAAQSPAFRQ